MTSKSYGRDRKTLKNNTLNVGRKKTKKNTQNHTRPMMRFDGRYTTHTISRYIYHAHSRSVVVIVTLSTVGWWAIGFCEAPKKVLIGFFLVFNDLSSV